MSTFALLSFVASAVFASLATFTLARGPSVPARRMGILSVLLALNSLANGATMAAPDAVVADAWNRVGVFTWGVIVPLQLLVLLGLTRWRMPGSRRWLAIVFLPAATVMTAVLTGEAISPDRMLRTSQGWAWDLVGMNFVGITIAVYLAATAAVLFAWRIRARGGREILQSSWLLGSGATAVVASAIFVAFNPLSLSPDLPRIPHLFALVFAAGYTIAILRYGLLDLRPALAIDHVLAAMQDLFLLVTPDGQISAANERSTALLGMTPSELRGRSLVDLAEDPQQGIRILEGVLSHRAGPVGEVSLRSREGAPIPVLLAGAPILGSRGERVGVALVAQDQRPVRELLKAERLESIGMLAGGIAHDFNNLLTGISGFIQIARTELPGECAIDEHLGMAESACFRAVDLTQQLLTFSRGGSPMRHPTQLADVIRESAGFATSGSPVRLDVDLPDDLWTVHGDVGQLSRVVHNLVLNAVQAMPAGGVVRIRGENVSGDKECNGNDPDGASAGDVVRLTIEDDGPGIPAALHDRVFDPFFTTRPEGTGLGLAVADSVIRRHGGRLSLVSGPGRGATFRFDLPRGRPVAAVNVAVAGASVSGRRVLVMDDLPIVRQVAEQMLRGMDCAVETCSDGTEAVKRARGARDQGRPFHAIILDLTVPGGLGGAEAAKILRRDDPDVRLIVCSGYAEAPVMSRHTEHGFDALLPKPYSVDQLRQAVGGG